MKLLHMAYSLSTKSFHLNHPVLLKEKKQREKKIDSSIQGQINRKLHKKTPITYMHSDGSLEI